MGKMKAAMVSDFLDPCDIRDLKVRCRCIMFNMIQGDWQTASKTRNRLVRAYNSLNKAKGGLIVACQIGHNMSSCDGPDTWATQAWRRGIKGFILSLETKELKDEARRVIARLKDEWSEE